MEIKRQLGETRQGRKGKEKGRDKHPTPSRLHERSPEEIEDQWIPCNQRDDLLVDGVCNHEP